MRPTARKSPLLVAAVVLIALFYGIRDGDPQPPEGPQIEAAAAEVGTAGPAQSEQDGIGSAIGGLLSDSLASLTGSGSGASGAETAAPQGDWTVDVVATRAALNGLEVKGKAPKTGYSRSQFGRAWDDNAPVDLGGNGCDQRSDVLGISLTNKVMRDECIVESGTLNGPYTGKVIQYVRDRTPDVDIDHRIALQNSWLTGAQQWSAEKRLAFANDPRNLVAVDASANRQKGAADAATWLPPNKAYRCTYVATQVDVKSTYGLWVTQPEKDAIERVLEQC